MFSVRYFLVLVLTCLLANNAFAGSYTSCDWVPPGDVTTPSGTSTSPGYWYCMMEGDVSISPDVPEDYSGGSVGSSSPDLTDRDISTMLKCVLDNYVHSDIKFVGGRTMKKVNAWAFGLKSASGSAYSDWDFRSTNTSPGAGWVPIGGLTSTGYAYGRMYNSAFQAHSNFERDGQRSGAPSNSLSGPMTAFEMSLFVAGHEMGHLRANMSESEADWYGIDAVKRYRQDAGKKCPN